MTNSDLTLIALIGIILLMGIVKKTPLCDSPLGNKRIGVKTPTMPMSKPGFCAFPLTLGQDVESEHRQPLEITIIGGLILRQMLTLRTTPVIYLIFERFKTWLNKHGVGNWVIQENTP
jgi:hypothetical protein